MNETVTVPAAPTKFPNQTPLACRLRTKKVVGRQGPIPYMGEVEIENCSGTPLDIQYTMTPLQFLELLVIGPEGSVVSEGHFSDRFSPMHDPAVLRLLPGERFTSNVALLATLPRGRRLPGSYTVQASYCYQGVQVAAEPLAVEVANHSIENHTGAAAGDTAGD